ncbi:MAG TPA: PorV/PorQ family protein, partial [Ignavibacteriaceae bacterium]|nr:PorV/PorQ family protein [Ignavibacteriaceae bacterium]
MKKIFTAVFSLLIATALFSQSFISDVSKRGTTVAQFLSIGQGARATAMGSAFVAVSDDPSSIYWNPAGISKVKNAAFAVDHTQWIADINYNYMALVYNLGNFGAIGASFTVSDIDEMNVTTVEKPEGTGEKFGVTDAAFSIAWGMQLTDKFAIGFNPKFIYQSIWKMSATAIAIDMGVQYVTPFDGMILAMSISNFGTKMKMEGNSALIIYDPDPNSTGNNPSIPAYLQTDSWDLPLNFRVGIAYTPLNIENHKVLLSVDALHVSDNYEYVNLGAEYAFNDFIFLRGGYKSLFLNDSEESFALGFGLK